MAAAAVAESSRSSGASAGDSYIGSLISLTSRSEIRYEGILYNINTQESSLGLRNVRSFGTEGRKKDGPQVPASEKIYEYILFRGSDIKDLQVKASPPSQDAPIHNDPAIIQSQDSRLPPSSTSFPSAGVGSASDLSSHPAPEISSHTAHLGLPRSPFQGNLPLYQPAGSLGSWGSSPTPLTANGSGLTVPNPMPMYWQGYYAPPGSLPHLQQPLLRPVPGLSIPQYMQQPLQFPGLSTSLPSGSQNLQEFPSPLLPTLSSTLGSTSAATIPSMLALPQASLLAPEASSSHLSTKPTGTSPPESVPWLASSLEPTSLSQNMPSSVGSHPSLVPISVTSYQTMPLPDSTTSGSSISSQVGSSSANLAFVPQLASNSESVVTVSHNVPPSVSGNPRSVPVSSLNYQTLTHFVPPSVAPTSSSQIETSVPLVTPDQLLQSKPSVISSSLPLPLSPKIVEVKPEEAETKVVLTEATMNVAAEIKEPILPMPTPSRPKHNRTILNTHEFNRGRGRGRGRGNGYPHPMTKFTEDFDFTAMNEKFNKDEVWGHLGKNKAQSRDLEGDTEESYETVDEDEGVPSKIDAKPIYVKDDFFDSLSCDALDRGTRNGRPRFSEQYKIDTETFGDFSRHRPFRGGGRGFRGGGGRTRASYYGRGYGYGGRGRGPSGPYRPF